MADAAPNQQAHHVRSLSPRELDVLKMTALGLTNNQVGAGLQLSVHAVKFHLASIYRKLHVSNRTEAVVVYLRGVGETRDGQNGS